MKSINYGNLLNLLDDPGSGVKGASLFCHAIIPHSTIRAAGRGQFYFCRLPEKPLSKPGTHKILGPISGPGYVEISRYHNHREWRHIFVMHGTGVDTRNSASTADVLTRVLAEHVKGLGRYSDHAIHRSPCWESWRMVSDYLDVIRDLHAKPGATRG